MEREISLEEISDGKLYGLNDLVKVSCNDCEGCSACCHGMGSSIILDPYDVWQLTKGLKKSFEELLHQELELNVVEGMILPNLKLAGSKEQCSFLNVEERCSIHGFRPGFCRLFPLGRLYEENGVQYFLQVEECKKQNRTKMKVRKWLDVPEVKQNEQFVVAWHYFLKELQKICKESMDDTLSKKINLFVLRTFYQSPFDAEEEFYSQFYKRLQIAKEELLV